MLFGLVKREGMANVRVVLSGEVPAASDPGVARPRRAIASSRAMSARDIRAKDIPANTTMCPRRAGYRDDGRGMQTAPRSGYWMQQPDGSRVFYDRERMGPPPPPLFPPRPPGW